MKWSTSFAALLLLFASIPAQPQASIITVGYAINEMESAAQTLLKDAAAHGDSLRIKAATDVLVLISTMRDVLKDSLNQAESSLNRQQREVFSNARSLLKEANEGVSMNREQLQLSIEGLQQDVSNKLPWGTFPLVTRMSPGIVIPGREVMVPIRVRGVNLGEKVQVLKIGNNRFNAVGSGGNAKLSPVEARFEVPARYLVPPTNALRSIPASLTIDAPPQSIWNRIRNKRTPATLNLPLYIAPAYAGIYDVTATTESTRRINDSIRKEVFHRGKENGCTPFTYQPQPGWIIDPTTVRENWQRGEYGSVKHAPGANRPEKFSLEVCVKVKHNKGTQTVEMGWTEYQMETYRVEVPIERRTLHWVDEVLLPLPANTVSVTVSFSNFAGSKEVATGSRAFSYAESDYDMASKRIIVRAKPPAFVW